jgi:uncharacterized protein (TIGR02300 family)
MARSEKICIPEEAPMTTKADRGTKRTCQNPECGSRFYDLNRDPIVCPICSSEYVLTASPAAGPAAAAEKKPRAAMKKSVYPVEGIKPPDAPEAEGDEVLADVEEDTEPTAAEDDETFLEEEEEDGSDMSNIIGGPVAEPDEPQ